MQYIIYLFLFNVLQSDHKEVKEQNIIVD